jgi:calpain-7
MDEASRKAQAAHDEEAQLETACGLTALRHATRAAGFYMSLLQLQPRNKAQFRRRVGNLVTLGELLKASASWGHDRELPTREARLLLESSDLNKTRFMPWVHNPPTSSFAGPHYTDPTLFSLSAEQNRHVDGWVRATHLFPDGAWHPLRGGGGTETDLVQDLTPDCSVVASLCSAERRRILAEIMFPGDMVPENGKYVFKFHFNGCHRCVEIDDRLPASRTNRSIFVTDRQNPTSFWPALMEKAYLKVYGGYDFPGSNSGTDMWVLTGWIPEQVFLRRHISHDETLDLEKRWDAILHSFHAGDVIMTLGTGRFDQPEEEATGLVAEHDYGVLDITSEPERRILVKNPWCTSQVAQAHNSFWMTLADITQHFESIYLNWNPALLRHRQDHHFAWDLAPRPQMSSTVLDNPQYSVAAANKGVVWILLARHFVGCGDAAGAGAGAGTGVGAGVGAGVGTGTGFLSIFVFEKGGKKAAATDGSLHAGPFVDSPQTLLRLSVEAGNVYTVVPVREGLASLSRRFTLYFFSDQRLNIEPARDAMRYDTTELGSWTRRTAGGNSSSPMYGSNPQFSIEISKAGPLSVLLCTDDGDIDIHVDLVWAQGSRVESAPAVRSLLGHSREYVRKCAIVDLDHVDAGMYTAVCSTFHAGQVANFALRVRSRFGHAVAPVPRDVPGRLRHNLAPLAFAEGETAFRAPVAIGRLTKLSAAIFCSSSQHRPTTALRISIITGKGPDERLLATSADGEFQQPLASLATLDVDVEVGDHARGGLWVKVERVGANGTAEVFQVQLLSDGPITTGDWTPT